MEEGYEMDLRGKGGKNVYFDHRHRSSRSAQRVKSLFQEIQSRAMRIIKFRTSTATSTEAHSPRVFLLLNPVRLISSGSLFAGTSKCVV